MGKIHMLNPYILKQSVEKNLDLAYYFSGKWDGPQGYSLLKTP